MTDALDHGRQALSAHLRARTDAVMSAWRAAIAADPRVSAGDALPRPQLEDHLPAWLATFADVLAAPVGAPSARAAESAEAHDAEAHGVQRWQQGYDLQDVTREWGHLHRCLHLELERLIELHPELPGPVIAEARLKLVEQIGAATSLSAERYFHLERVEAAGTVLDLERALADLRELERRRGELWQQAAHDLRGNLGVVSNVAQGLTFDELPPSQRQDFLGMLRHNVKSLHHLLDDVTSLARLQAGQERRNTAPFDAAAELRGLCDDMRPLAQSKGLYLEARGPDPLSVEGDAVKVRRVAQNLLLNALKYTRTGGIAMTWDDAVTGDSRRWRFNVQDTGPGFHAGPGAPLAQALDRAVPIEPAQSAGAPNAAIPGPGDFDERPIMQAQGEGLGLAIVKRLCDLLDASVEFETVETGGTRVQVTLPHDYSRA